LLQFDTGGYLVRWFEGYLVPSRSVGVRCSGQLTVWVLALLLRAMGWRPAAAVHRRHSGIVGRHHPVDRHLLPALPLWRCTFFFAAARCSVGSGPVR
jgi:hypothetical protein